KALVSYAGDYGGYLPSWAGWPGPDFTWCRDGSGAPVYGSTGCASHANKAAMSEMYYGHRPGDTPIRVDGGATVGSTWSSRHETADYTSFRVIAWGSKYPATTYAVGQLNAAPNGMGFLLTSNYLSDASIFYCPSADGMIGDKWDLGKQGAYSLGHWRTLGGFSSSVLLYGDWGKMNYTLSGVRMAYSHYNYRNTPLLNDWHKYQDNLYPLPGTKNQVKVRVLQPYFRTQRELGGRAIVSDTFSKGTVYDANGINVSALYNNKGIEESRKIFGMGIKAHQTAYNTLYGDGRAAVFGDPQMSIAFHTQGRPTVTYAYYPGANCIAFNYFETYFFRQNYRNFQPITSDWVRNTSIDIWHTLDIAGGADADADAVESQWP
ncbi:MAG TPA: hypothetical protein P5137_17870, partial [Candidatus Brocadiia bacterium]|nr:hypothetical protein [Candidatus Brocadiia bacterium]